MAAPRARRAVSIGPTVALFPPTVGGRILVNMLITLLLPLIVTILGCCAIQVQADSPAQAVLSGPSRPWPHSKYPGGNCQNVHQQQTHLMYSSVPSPPLEIYPLITSGPTNNRVDLVFFSDGYLLEERDKFIQDATRLAEDVSTNQTFATVRPLLNFWAAFTPSKESGIGVGGKPKDTPFGLYRDGTELRGVYYSKPEVAGAACDTLGDQCDYPILLGNDPYYGGLGGEFTVITSSLANGPLVLRHELGHSIIDVGEEYDGGFAYFGVNAYHNLSEPVPWAHWLSSNQARSPRVEQSVMSLQLYTWTLLNTSTPWSTTFFSSGTYPRHLLKFSLSGLPDARDLKVELDGVDLGWSPKNDIGLDRWHYDIPSDTALSPGPHEVAFTLLNPTRAGAAQLCSVEVLEFKAEDKFNPTPGNYGVYPTLATSSLNSIGVLFTPFLSYSFSDKNETSYRPTNDDCLMRSVITPNFCKVCIEGLWISLLGRISLIDDIKENCEKQNTNWGTDGEVASEWVKTLELELVPLAQFRKPRSQANETYTIKWWKDNKPLKDFINKTRIELSDSDAIGTYSINVTFATDEVRVDKNNSLSTGFKYKVEHACGSKPT